MSDMLPESAWDACVSHEGPAIRIEIVVEDPDLGCIARATDLETGLSALGASSPVRRDRP